ncbi:MAG: O-antigen ligase family protein [Limnohabitans sp.]
MGKYRMPDSKPLPHTIMLPVLLFMAMSSLNAKAMGAAWTLLAITGLWAWWHTRHDTDTRTPPWIKTWLIATGLAMALKTVPALYWADPWAERHGEIRLLLGALAVWGLIRWRTLETLSVDRIAHALTISSALGLAWVLRYGRGEVCTHPIPWAVSMAMVSGWLLAMGLRSDASALQRRVWLLGGLLALLAVLASQSRGAFGIVAWWAATLLLQAWKNRHHIRTQRRLMVQSLWVTVALGAALWTLSYTPVLQRPAQSLRDAVHEITRSQQSAAAGADSSVGSRLYMWQRSLEVIVQSPWIGRGHDGRKQALASWAAQAQSDEIAHLGHLHNEFLNQLVDHGLWGLASQLSYILGLLWIVKQLMQAQKKTSARVIGCIAFMHMSSSVSNVNFAHNYYTTALSMLVMLGLWLAPPDAEKQKEPTGSLR